MLPKNQILFLIFWLNKRGNLTDCISPHARNKMVSLKNNLEQHNRTSTTQLLNILEELEEKRKQTLKSSWGLTVWTNDEQRWWQAMTVANDEQRRGRGDEAIAIVVAILCGGSIIFTIALELEKEDL